MPDFLNLILTTIGNGIGWTALFFSIGFFGVLAIIGVFERLGKLHKEFRRLFIDLPKR